jgi:hypothetical protein
MPNHRETAAVAARTIRKPTVCGYFPSGRYWARTSDFLLVRQPPLVSGLVWLSGESSAKEYLSAKEPRRRTLCRHQPKPGRRDARTSGVYSGNVRNWAPREPGGLLPGTVARMITNCRTASSKAQKGTELQALREAGATGLEPATSGVTGRRSNQLSYAP